jgi:hypothetical protein
MIRTGDGRRRGLGLTRRCFSMRHGPTLFTPVLLLLLLGGIQVARGDDKPTSNDLGNIRPPGGAPLPLGEPGRPGIKVELLNKVRKRLEAAPAEALDKWVVELERIMDQKLEGELAKQACRTYFVTRMSVAFDDLHFPRLSNKALERG